MQKLCRNTVSIYINKYNKYDLNRLILDNSNGAPRLLSTAQEKKLLKLLKANNTPNEFNFQLYILLLSLYDLII